MDKRIARGELMLSQHLDIGARWKDSQALNNIGVARKLVDIVILRPLRHIACEWLPPQSGNFLVNSGCFQTLGTRLASLEFFEFVEASSRSLLETSPSHLI